MAGIGGANGFAAGRRGVHAEGAEQPHVPPALHVLGKPAAFVHADIEPQPPASQGRFQPNRPGADDRQPRRVVFEGHAVGPKCE
jgi:hypothetical protein